MSASTWHGLTDAQVLATWDQLPWREGIARALVRIAMCEYMPYPDRSQALALLNEGLIANVLSDPHLDYASFVGRVMTSMVLGHCKQRWWHRWRIRQMREQSYACERMLRTAINFAPRYVPQASETPVLDALLS